MNNCYWTNWNDESGNNGEHDDEYQSYTDEQRDRSLPYLLELSWSIHHHQDVSVQYQLEDEELPDDEMSPTVSTFSSPSRSIINNGNHQQECIQHHQIPEPTRRVDGIPASTSRPLTSGRKFLSRSHNSLLSSTFQSSPTPDYSKVESKVKQYIQAMKAQKKRNNGNKAQGTASQNTDHPIQNPSAGDGCKSSAVIMLDSSRQWAEQEERIRVLQEDHDRLLLANARLQNQLDEMRAKFRRQQELQENSFGYSRRTNSPPNSIVSNASSLDSFNSNQGPNALLVEKLKEAASTALAIRDQSRHLLLIRRKMGPLNGAWETAA